MAQIAQSAQNAQRTRPLNPQYSYTVDWRSACRESYQMNRTAGSVDCCRCRCLVWLQAIFNHLFEINFLLKKYTHRTHPQRHQHSHLSRWHSSSGMSGLHWCRWACSSYLNPTDVLIILFFESSRLTVTFTFVYLWKYLLPLQCHNSTNNSTPPPFTVM